MGWRRCFMLVLGLAAAGCGARGPELLNVSYDPTRELYKEVNAAFRDHWKQETGQALDVRQSHGGSSTQARSVLDGLDADVVTLALWPDTDSLRRKGLIADGWEDRLPNRSLPYYSTIVFLVRKGNPKGIHDWADLVDPDKKVEIIAANPKTGGGARLVFLAAWGSVVTTPGKSEADAQAYVTELYRRFKVMDPSARASTVTFTQKKLGDVHLNWENEAKLAVEESKGELEIVYPSKSLRCEPKVALVDAVVERKKTREQAEAYLKFLYTPAAQEIIARNHFRPTDPDVAEKHKDDFRPIELFEIERVAPGGWGEAQERFFGSNGVFDTIYDKATHPTS
jgi:sulfate transport system substrate-binding protein